MLDGDQLWQGGTTMAAVHGPGGPLYGGAMFGPEGPLAAWTTYSVTCLIRGVRNSKISCTRFQIFEILQDFNFLRQDFKKIAKLYQNCEGINVR